MLTDRLYRKNESNKNDDRLYKKYADGKDSRKYSSIELKSKEPETELAKNTFPLKRVFLSETRLIPFFFLLYLFYTPNGKSVRIAQAKMPDHPIWHPFFPLKFICLPDTACLLNDGADCAQNHQCTAKQNSKGFHNFSPCKVGKVGTARISFISSGKELALLAAKSSDPYPWTPLKQNLLPMSNIFYSKQKIFLISKQKRVTENRDHFRPDRHCRICSKKHTAAQAATFNDSIRPA